MIVRPNRLLTAASLACVLAQACCSAPAPGQPASGLAAPLDFPQALQPGDTVRVVAPSSYVQEDALLSALDQIRSLGLKPVYRADILAQHVDFAGAVGRRADELQEALDDADARAIWPVRGGYGATFLLPGLDLRKVRAARKWLIGFSDVTVLHAAWAQAGVGSLHGPIGTYLERWEPEAVQALRDSLFTGDAYTLRGQPVHGAATVQGVLAGGNLALLASLVGTGFLPSWDGAILVLEDVYEAPYRLERNLLQLHQAGAFQGVRAVLLGQFTDCTGSVNPGPDPLPARERVIEFLSAHLQVPIVADLPVGHEPNARALPLGARATVDAATGQVTLHALR